MAKRLPSVAAMRVDWKSIVPTPSPAAGTGGEGPDEGEGLGGVGEGATGLGPPSGSTRIMTRIARAAIPTATAKVATLPHRERGGGSPGSRGRTSGHQSGPAMRAAAPERGRRAGLSFRQEAPQAGAS